MSTTTQSRLPQQSSKRDLVTIEKQVEYLDSVATDFAAQLAKPIDSRLVKMVVTSKALQTTRAALTDDIMTTFIMPLMGSDLGFKTDKPYEPAIVRECVIEALLKDFNLTGNEFNIIAGRFYGAQAGYYRKLKSIPGLTDLETIPGVPSMGGGQTIVKVVLKCKLNGVPWTLKDSQKAAGRVFVIRVNQGMGADAIIGKALRKAYKAAFEEITGTEITDQDDAGTELPTPEQPKATSKAAQVAEQLSSGNGSGKKISEAQLHAVNSLVIELDLPPEELQAIVTRCGAAALETATAEQGDAIRAALLEIQAKQSGE